MFFVACCIGISSHFLGFLQFHHHRGGVHELFPTVVVEDGEVLGLYSVIPVPGYGSVLFSLALRHS